MVGERILSRKIYEYDGKRLTLAELAREKKVSWWWLNDKIKKYGFDLALNMEMDEGRPRTSLAEDLVGREFGWLKIMERANLRPKDTHGYWKCQCKCGNVIEVPSNSLKLGRTKSCGCLKRSSQIPVSIEPRKKFGRLTVIEKIESQVFHGRTRSAWLCQCDCGNTCAVAGRSLRRGDTKSCGCLKGKPRTAIAPSL